MDIKTKFSYNFIKALNKLKETYGDEFAKVNGFHNSNLNFTDFIANFIDTKVLADTTIDSNANNYMKDVSSMMREMTKPHQKLISYNKIHHELCKTYGVNTADEWLEAEYNGTYYLHNSHTSSYISYCFAYSLEDIANKGLLFLGKFKTDNAKHLDTFNNHVLEFISYASNRTSGAVGLPDYLIYAYYFYKKDKESNYLGITDFDKYKKQQFQTFIYNLNQPYLRVTESSFTNISIYDEPYLIALFGNKTFPDGTPIIDEIENIKQFQKEFMEVVSKVRSENMFTFPVLSYSLLFQNGEFVDKKYARWCSDHNTKWYDSNFFIGEDVTSLSTCCRLVNNFKEIEKKKNKLNGFINSIGGTQLKIGSVQVNTINLMRIALLSNGNKEKFIELLKHYTELNLKVLHTIRNIISRNIEKGLLPIYDYKLIDINNQFNTIGITAFYDAIKYMGMVEKDIIGYSNYSTEGLEFSSKIMDTINEIKNEFEDGVNYSVNVENVPAESANVKLNYKDRLLFKDFEFDTDIYSNQWIALSDKATNTERIKLSSILDKKCGGGQILHINLESGFANTEQAWKNLNDIAKSGVIYFAYNIKISACEENHAFIGEICPICGKEKIETYSRIVGFLVPYSAYSKERKKEFTNRLWY